MQKVLVPIDILKKLHSSEEIVQKVIGIYMDRTKYKKIRKNTFLKIITVFFFF